MMLDLAEALNPLLDKRLQRLKDGELDDDDDEVDESDNGEQRNKGRRLTTRLGHGRSGGRREGYSPRQAGASGPKT